MICLHFTERLQTRMIISEKKCYVVLSEWKEDEVVAVSGHETKVAYK